MKLVSTKRPKKTLKTENKPYAPDPYPYSTRLSLDKHVLEKLDISPKDFKVGQTVCIEAYATVKSLRQIEGSEYDENQIELQITDIGIEKEAGSMKDAVDEAVKGAK